MSFLERVDQTIRRSPVWRSLFRQPYPNDERSRAYAVMNNVFLHLHPVRVRQHAVKFAYTFCLGGLSFFLFLVLTVTGVYLMFFYVPSATQAYTDILDIQTRGHVRAADPEHPSVGRPPDGVLRLPAHDAGLLPRGLQAAARVQLGRRRGPALPDDHAQLHRLPAAVGPDRLLGDHDRHEHGRLRAAVQHAGQPVLLLGGLEVGQNTLLRFYVLHIMVFPLVAAIFLAVHFWRIRKTGDLGRYDGHRALPPRLAHDVSRSLRAHGACAGRPSGPGSS